ncbi:MAG: endonuclease III, partial [Desulfurivibrionaceae bacterium]
MEFSLPEVLQILSTEVAGYAVPIVDLIAVQTKDPYKVLVATILSARTKDETTAKAAARLFAEAPNLAALAALSEERLAKLIFPVGFYKNKAGFLARLPGVLESEFGNQIPDEVEALTRLPGVGRKTANLVVAVAFKKPAICVDTHVHRIMNIWGYVETKTPLETEMALREKLPPQYWLTINSTLVAFGQGTCKPVAPHCDRCVIAQYCPRIGVTPRKVVAKNKKTGKDGMRRFV